MISISSQPERLLFAAIFTKIICYKMSTTILRYNGKIVFDLMPLAVLADSEKVINLNTNQIVQWETPNPPDHIKNATYGNLFKEIAKYSSSSLISQQIINFVGVQRFSNRTEPGIATVTTKYGKLYNTSNNTDHSYKLPSTVHPALYYQYDDINTTSFENKYPTSVTFKLEKICVNNTTICTVSTLSTTTFTFTLNISVSIPCASNQNELICGGTGQTGGTGPTGGSDPIEEPGSTDGFDIQKNWWIILVVIIVLLLIIGIILLVLLVLWKKGIIFAKKP